MQNALTDIWLWRRMENVLAHGRAMACTARAPLWLCLTMSAKTQTICANASFLPKTSAMMSCRLILLPNKVGIMHEILGHMGTWTHGHFNLPRNHLCVLWYKHLHLVRDNDQSEKSIACASKYLTWWLLFYAAVHSLYVLSIIVRHVKMCYCTIFNLCSHTWWEETVSTQHCHTLTEDWLRIRDYVHVSTL